MTVVLKFEPATEANLAAMAAVRGIGVADLVRRLVEEWLAEAGAGRTSAQRVAAWGEIGQGLPPRPLLSDQAIARDSLYGPRG